MNIKELTDEITVQKLKQLIDPTSFGTVVNYFNSKDVEIDFIYSVRSKEELPHIAALFCGATKTLMVDIVDIYGKMFEKKIVTQIIPKQANINVKQLCWVIMLPPAYIIYIEPEKLYE